MTTRKGAMNRAAIPVDVLAGLNAGTLASANLVEGLAVDFAMLLAGVCPELPSAAVEQMAQVRELGVVCRMRMAAVLLAEYRGPAVFDRLCAHPSDTARGWAAFVLADTPGLTLSERLYRMRRLADDSHFGVREWAWLALRPVLALELDDALRLLLPWSHDPSANIRRFAIEITRPRGVWTGHLPALKADPSPARPLLDAVIADPSRYVADSCGNWLNDAAKSRPDWVVACCNDWRRRDGSDTVAYVLRRALRSLPGKI